MNKRNVILVDSGMNFCNNIENHFTEHPELNYLNADFNIGARNLEQELGEKKTETFERMMEQNKFMDKTYLVLTDNAAESTLILATLAKSSKLSEKLRKVILLCYKYDSREFEEMKRTDEGQTQLGFIKDKLELLNFDEEGINGFGINEDIEEVKNNVTNTILRDTFINNLKLKLQDFRNRIKSTFSPIN